MKTILRITDHYVSDNEIKLSRNDVAKIWVDYLLGSALTCYLIEQL